MDLLIDWIDLPTGLSRLLGGIDKYRQVIGSIIHIILILIAKKLYHS